MSDSTAARVHEIEFFYDPISPYAYLAFERLPQALMGHSVHLRYRPVLFGALLKANGQLGPAEIPGKRDWTYQQCGWLAQHHGVRFELPTAHPFNPLALLRLGLACASEAAPGETNRLVTEMLFHHVWQGGHDAVDPARLADLQARLQEHVSLCGREWLAPDSAEVKQGLRANTDAALALGLFGVPALVLDGRVFWGQDALPMLRACMDGDTWFQSGAWEAAAVVPAGVRRQP
jgi:2-hydroxychromene-2-carboxylate isomerase